MAKKWTGTTLVDPVFTGDNINKALLDLLDKINQTYALQGSGGTITGNLGVTGALTVVGNQTTTGLVTVNGNQIISGYTDIGVGADVASATTITPTGQIFRVTGAVAIATINLPFTSFSGQITLIPTGAFTTTIAGNIALASTAVVSKALILTYLPATGKWHPSY